MRRRQLGDFSACIHHVDESKHEKRDDSHQQDDDSQGKQRLTLANSKRFRFPRFAVKEELWFGQYDE